MKKLRRARLRITALIFVSGAVASFPAHGQQTPANLAPAQIIGSAQPMEPLSGSLPITPFTPTDVIGQEVLGQPGRVRLSQILAFVPEVGESYAVTGYYENFTIHGFLLDLGSDYRINGFVVPGEMDIAVDNKLAIELVKGSSSVAPGATSAYGSVNYLSKPAANVESAELQFNQWLGRQIAFDFGSAATASAPIGWRINAASEVFAPGVSNADGHRTFLSLALDAQPVDGLRISLDLESQEKAQRAVPGLQLLGGTSLPPLGVSDININDQSWSRPVINNSSFAGVRAEYEFGNGALLRVGAADGVAKISDNLAFPDGCDSPPYQYFCSNGQYEIFDYHANERRATRQGDASLSLPAQFGALSSTLSLGVENIERTVEQTDLYSSLSSYPDGTPALGSIFNQVALPAPSPGPVSSTYTTQNQTTISLLEQLRYGALRVLVGERLAEVHQNPGDSASHALPQIAAELNLAHDLWLHAAHTTSLAFGSIAPIAAENAGAVLAPRLVRQDEAGLNWQVDQNLQLGATLSRIARAFEFTAPVGDSFAGLGNYQQRGSEVHRVLDTSIIASRGPLRIQFDASYLDAIANGSGFATLDGVQQQNVPRWKTSTWLHYQPIQDADFGVGAITVGRRNASSYDAASAPGYTRLDALAAWPLEGIAKQTELSLGVINLLDRRYWRDVGFAYGADLLFPAPQRTVTAALHVVWR